MRSRMPSAEAFRSRRRMTRRWICRMLSLREITRNPSWSHFSRIGVGSGAGRCSWRVDCVGPCSGAHRAGTYLTVLDCTITVTATITPTSILIIATTIIHVINILRLLILLLNYYSCYRYYYYHCRGGDPNIPAMGGTPAREAPRHKG